MSTSRTRRKPARSSSATKDSPTKPAASDGSGDVRGELRQLAEIRGRFPALDADTAAALHAHHDDDACRAKGTATRAADTFRGAMSWARTFGAHAANPALEPRRIRWFLDCATALGVVLTGQPAVDPTQASAFEDATQTADKLLRRTERRARDAAGTVAAAVAAVDAALQPDGVLDDRISRLRQLAALLTTWLGQPVAKAPPLRVFGIGASTVADLTRAATALDEAIARRGAPKMADRDGPAVNIAEGRLQFVMRSLWTDLAEAREDGVTDLVLTVSPTILRALNIKPKRKQDATKPA
ncbi:MAG: hypothetical protein IPF99_21555 [Deltaproteobacteria bacterium]|jgi:hypothetical protein|nr:hypothetical protein [Deltaproteobacteria bacterium]